MAEGPQTSAFEFEDFYFRLGNDLANILDSDDITKRVIATGLGGNDSIFGGTNADILAGGVGSDQLYGNEGDDLLYDELGSDILDGGDDFDTVEYVDLNKAYVSSDISGFTIIATDKALGNYTVETDYVTGPNEIDTISSVERIAHAEQQVNAYESGVQHSLSISARSGGYVSFWQSAGQGGKTHAIIRQEFDLSGNKVGSESLVMSGGGVQQISPESAELNSGGYVVAFQGRNTGSKIKTFAKIFDTSGTSADIEVFKDPTTGNTAYDNSLKTQEFAKDVAVLTSGNIFAVAQASGNFTQSGQFDIIGKFLDAGGNALAEKFIVNDDAQAGWQTAPSVAALTSGNAVVTWTSADSSSDGVYFRIIDTAGAGVTSTTQVNTSTSYSQNESDVAALKDGGFVVTWTDQGGADGSGYGIFFKLYNNSGTEIIGETQVNELNNSTQWQSEVAALDDGGFVITFTDGQSTSDGSATSVWAQQYDKYGSEIQDNFLVNITTSGTQQNTAVAGLGNGDFAIAWEDQTSEVFARLYSNSAEIPSAPPGSQSAMSGGGGSSLLGTAQSSNLAAQTAQETPLYEEPDFFIRGNGVLDLIEVSKGDYNKEYVEVVQGFSVEEGDVLDLSDLFAARDYVSEAISDFIALSEAGGDTLVLVDRDGSRDHHEFQTVAFFQDTLGLDTQELLSDGHIIA